MCVHWVSFLGDRPSLVSLGLLVTFACRCGLNNRGGFYGGSRGRRDLHPKLLSKIQKIQRRAHTTKRKYKNKSETCTKKQNTIINSETRGTKSKHSRQYKPLGESCGQIHKGCFARELVCANTTLSELRDKTMFGRSKWCRTLALVTHFRGVPKKNVDSNVSRRSTVCAKVTTGKRKATASLASDSVREHAAVRVGHGQPRAKC